MNLDATREHQDHEYTTRETTRHVGVTRKKKSDFDERRCNTIQVFHHETFVSGPRQIRPCGNREAFAQRMSELCEFDTIPLRRATRCFGKPKAALRFRRHEHDHKNASSSWTAISLAIQSREKHYVIGGSDQ